MLTFQVLLCDVFFISVYRIRHHDRRGYTVTVLQLEHQARLRLSRAMEIVLRAS